MSDAPPPEPTDSGTLPPPRRGLPPWLIGLVLVVGLGAMMFVGFRHEAGGPPIVWIENDLDFALGQVSDAKPRVFLYLYDPDDPRHQRNELQVFTTRWARESVQNIISCRVAMDRPVSETQRLAGEYHYRDQPLFLLLTRDGQPQMRAEGAVTEKEFMTAIGRPAEAAVRNAREHAGEGK